MWPWPLRPAANTTACVTDERTCSSPPFRSSSSFGWPGSGLGLPLCRHHRASSDALQENGPSRRRLWSLSPILTDRSCSSSCKDTAWSTSRNTDTDFWVKDSWIYNNKLANRKPQSDAEAREEAPEPVQAPDRWDVVTATLKDLLVVDESTPLSWSCGSRKPFEKPLP